MSEFINKLIMWCMQKQLERLRKTQDTPYIFIKGTNNDFPKYLMYTDNEKIRHKMHSIK
jgi:hypothetical protein